MKPGEIVVDRVSRRFRVSPNAHRTLKDVFVSRGRRAGDRGLGAARRLAPRGARRGGRARRPQRLREDDAAPHRLRDHQADRRDASPSAAGSARCSSSAPASTPTSPAARTSTSTARSTACSRAARPRADGRDRRVRRARAVHRPAGADVLVRDVHAARLLGRRRTSRPTCCSSTRCSPSATRSSSASASARSPSSSSAAARSCSSRTTRSRSSGSATAPCCCGRARSRSTGRRATRSRATASCSPRSAARTSSAPACASGGAARRGSSPRSSSTPTATSASRPRPASGSSCGSSSRRERDVPPPTVSLELRDDDGVVLGARLAADGRARLGRRGPASASSASSSSALPLAEGRFHLRCALVEADGGRLLHSLDDAVSFLVVPTGRRDRRGAPRRALVDAGTRRLRANRSRMSARSCPDWPDADGARARAPVQALHAPRGAGSLPADALVLLDVSASTRRRSAATSRATCSTRSTPIRTWPRRSARRTGSTCASGPRASSGAPPTA